MEKHGSPKPWRTFLTCGLTPELHVLWDIRDRVRGVAVEGCWHTPSWLQASHSMPAL